jgi:L-lysine exporter family protein LysE/ArgO
MALLEGLALGGALIIAIGPQNAFVLRQGLAGRHVFAVATVCFLSDVLLIAIGAAGVGTAIRAYPQILETVAWLGCLFLLGFALRSFYRAYRAQEVMDAAGGVHGALGTARLGRDARLGALVLSAGLWCAEIAPVSCARKYLACD